MNMAIMQGARLAWVVVEVEGSVHRKVHKYMPKKGIVESFAEEPGGFLVYCPRGHVVRLRDKAALRQYGVHRDAPIVNLDKLTDPKTPLGRLMLAQDDATRRGAMDDMQKAVMKLAQAQSGKIEITRDQRDLETEEEMA